MASLNTEAPPYQTKMNYVTLLEGDGTAKFPKQTSFNGHKNKGLMFQTLEKESTLTSLSPCSVSLFPTIFQGKDHFGLFVFSCVFTSFGLFQPN